MSKKCHDSTDCFPCEAITNGCMKQLQTEISDWKSKAEHWKTRYDTAVTTVRQLQAENKKFEITAYRTSQEKLIKLNVNRKRKRKMSKSKKFNIIVSVLSAIVGISVGIWVVTHYEKTEKSPKTRPIGSFLTPTKQDWKNAYGDTLETQIVFNLSVLHHNQQELLEKWAVMFPLKDPNSTKKVKKGWFSGKKK